MSESADIVLDVGKKSEDIAPDLFFTHNGNENDEDELEMIKIELYSDFEDEDDQLAKSNDTSSLKKDPNSNSQILDQFKNPRTKVPIEIRKQIVGKFYSVIIVILFTEKTCFFRVI